MKIDIAKKDLWTIRSAINSDIYQKEHCADPSVWGDAPKVLRKLNRKLNMAMKRTCGHDCGGNTYYT